MSSAGGKAEVEHGFRFYFDAKAWRKMMFYTKHATGEISGLGVVEEVSGGLWVKDVFITKQKATGVSVDVDPQHLSDIVYQKIRGGDINFASKLRLWWHSHVHMDTFHSSTDRDTVQKMGANCPYLLSVVTNKDEDYEAWLSVFKPFRATVTNADIMIIHEDGELEEQCKNEVETLVEKETVTYPFVQTSLDKQDWNEYWGKKYARQDKDDGIADWHP